jgi:LDH2 family malate/lactate/ureidoglycolate dehydrogenase
MELNPNMELERESPASALLNARNGLGQIAGTKAMALAMDKAATGGVGLVAVKNSNHFGIAAFFAMQALKRDMVGLVITNASPAIAPYGTKTPLTGTNPVAVAIPAAGQRPIVLDMSTSVVARGKIRLASVLGEAIPLGWALDTEGKPTQDAKAALKGSMEPIGGPKGSGLSLIIDLLCGVLTGTSLTGEVRNVTDNAGPSKTSHMFIAINIAKFIDPEQFKKNIDEVIRRIKSLPPVGNSPAYLPGEIEFNLEAKRRMEGIPLSTKVLAELQNLAQKYGVPEKIG